MKPRDGDDFNPRPVCVDDFEEPGRKSGTEDQYRDDQERILPERFLTPEIP